MAFDADGTQTPEHGQGQQQAGNEPGLDYERSYNELRPEYTRTTQELKSATERLSEYEQLFEAISDPTTQAEALSALGFEVDTGTTQHEVDEFIDPLEQDLAALRDEVVELRQWREQSLNEDQQAQIIDLRDDYIGESIGFIEEQTKQKFSEQEEEVLGNLAIAMANDDGVPDVQAAYSAIYGDTGVLEIRRGQWVQSKDNAFTAPLGTTIPADKRPVNGRQRVEFIDERLRALDQE